MLQNEYLVAKIGVDRAENEPSKVSPKWGVQIGSFRGHVSLEKLVTKKVTVDTCRMVKGFSRVQKGFKQVNEEITELKDICLAMSPKRPALSKSS